MGKRKRKYIVKNKSQYNSLVEWQKADPSAYAVAQRKGLIDVFCEHFGWHKKKPNGYWTLDTCREDALKYKTKKQWREKSTGYDIAIKNGWEDACCDHMIRNRNWTIETCKEEALKYKTRQEWKKNRVGYDAAQKNGWLEECCAHMRDVIKPSGYWTLDKCKEDGLKYKTRIEWKKCHPHVYRITCRNGWIEECCVHMEKITLPRGYWTFEKCKEDALKYKTKIEWRANSPGYDAAVRKEWYKECCTHMTSGYKEEQLKRNENRKVSI